jgi:hypothetical protein
MFRAMTSPRAMGLLTTCAVLALGLRGSFGLFPAPVAGDLGWPASGFAWQVPLNGLAQPIAGPIADCIGGAALVTLPVRDRMTAAAAPATSG